MIKNYKVEVTSEEDAAEKGYFSGAITRDRLLKAITKRNPEIRIIYGKEHAGLFDKQKGFICGVSRRYYIPMFTIHNTTTNKVLCRSWKSIINILRRKGYEINENDLY